MPGQSRGALLNYSTTIPSSKTVGEIQHYLIQHGAVELRLETDGRGKITGITFALALSGGTTHFRLPANIAGCLQKLEREYADGKIRAGYVNAAQAERTAWRIVKDWVEAQTAIVEANMVRMETVFLPYLLVDGPGGERTMDQIMVASGYFLPERTATRDGGAR